MENYEFTARRGGTVRLSEGDLRELESLLRGGLLRPDHPAFEPTRHVWNGLVDRRPGAILLACSTADVVAGVAFARDHGLRLSVRGGGYDVAGGALVDGGLTIDLSDLKNVRVDSVLKVARAGGGARLGDVDHETQAYGMAVPLGPLSEAGIGGLTLHGGIGWLTRRFGLTADNLISADVVTADGEIRVVDSLHEQELFWVLRGGGGGFGVVTSFEFRTYRLGPDVYSLDVAYPLDSYRAVLSAVRDFMAEAPEELGLLASLRSTAGLGFGDEAQAEPAVVLFAAYTGPVEYAERLLAPLRSIVPPLGDRSAVTSFAALQRRLDAGYPRGRHYDWKSVFFNDLDDGVLEILAEYDRRRPSFLSSLDVWFLGGAPQRLPVDATAFAARTYPYLVGILAGWERPDDDEANVDWARSAYLDLRAVSQGGPHLNFPSVAGDESRSAAYGPNWDRLLRAKAVYDPEGLFRGVADPTPAGVPEA